MPMGFMSKLARQAMAERLKAWRGVQSPDLPSSTSRRAIGDLVEPQVQNPAGLTQSIEGDARDHLAKVAIDTQR